MWPINGTTIMVPYFAISFRDRARGRLQFMYTYTIYLPLDTEYGNSILSIWTLTRKACADLE